MPYLINCLCCVLDSFFAYLLHSLSHHKQTFNLLVQSLFQVSKFEANLGYIETILGGRKEERRIEGRKEMD